MKKQDEKQTVFNTRTHELGCPVCLALEKIEFPQAIVVFVKKIKAFDLAHRKCREKK